MISLYRDQKNTVPFLYEEGDGDWIRMASELMESAGYYGFLTLVLRDGDGWALERFDPLPAPGIPWEECLTVLLG